MKLKKILNEITKLHEENNEMKIQLLRKQRSLDCVNKERDDLFLENNRLKDKLKELIDLQFELDRLSGYQMTKEEVETFKDLKDFIKDSVARNHYKPVGINSLVEKLDKSKEMEFEERLQRAVDRLDKDHEIDDIEDELNEASNSNTSNPCIGDEDVEELGWNPYHEEPWDRFEVGDEDIENERITLIDKNGDSLKFHKSRVEHHEFYEHKDGRVANIYFDNGIKMTLTNEKDIDKLIEFLDEKDHEITDIEDELNKTSDSNQSNPEVQEDDFNAGDEEIILTDYLHGNAHLFDVRVKKGDIISFEISGKPTSYTRNCTIYLKNKNKLLIGKEDIERFLEFMAK